jgi:hypothetical protein
MGTFFIMTLYKDQKADLLASVCVDYVTNGMRVGNKRLKVQGDGGKQGEGMMRVAEEIFKPNQKSFRQPSSSLHTWRFAFQ